ncbi:hypothetical protein [Actinomadura sp. 9N407]|uniref:hypothetical protein n=1 Tax=Actinomadura sp. 9N407 TaxID=3375154 RepID=UPI0037AF506B
MAGDVREDEGLYLAGSDIRSIGGIRNRRWSTKNMRSIAELQIPDPLRRHHRRCLAAMTRLTLAVDEPFPGQDHGAVAAEAVTELRAAALILQCIRAEAGENAPIARFLTCRLDRLAVGADGITAASTAGDLAVLRRRVIQFRALVASMWKVQLAVGAKPPGRPARPVARERAYR